MVNKMRIYKWNYGKSEILFLSKIKINDKLKNCWIKIFVYSAIDKEDGKILYQEIFVVDSYPKFFLGLKAELWRIYDLAKSKDVDSIIDILKNFAEYKRKQFYWINYFKKKGKKNDKSSNTSNESTQRKEG